MVTQETGRTVIGTLFLGTLFLAPLLFCPTACGPPLPEPYIVQDLRVIAMVAESPEIAAGEATFVDVYFFDPDSDEREVLAFSYQCADLGSVGCLAVHEAPAQQSSTQMTARVQTDLYKARFPVSTAADFFADKDALSLFYGDEILFLARGGNGLRTIDGFKRISISPPRRMRPSGAPALLPQVKNVNPVLIGFLLKRDETVLGEAADVAELERGVSYTLTPRYDPTSLQPYEVVDFDGNLQAFDEKASFSWSCSPTCHIDQRITYDEQIVTLVPPLKGAESDRLSVHVVMRDGRGGEAVFVQSFHLRAAQERR